MLTFQTEKVATLCEAAQDLTMLAQDHWNEVEASLHGKQEYALDISTYSALEKMHMLHVSTARDDKGQLCGYAVFVLNSWHHAPAILCATLDAFYLAPTVRKGFAALRLLREAEKILQARGIHKVQYSSPASRPCDALYRRLGAKHTESLFHKNLHGDSSTS